MTDEEPELIIDSDWKAQVEKEKQQATEVTSEEKPAPADASAPSEERGPIPPATLEMLLTTMYTQTMMSLGAMANPSSGEVNKDLPMAKHFIDTIEMLQEKTKGNTSDEENKMFEELLHVLRMAYVESSK